MQNKIIVLTKICHEYIIMTNLTGSEVNASGSVLPNPITSGTGGNSANYGSKLVGGKKAKKTKSVKKTKTTKKHSKKAKTCKKWFGLF